MINGGKRKCLEKSLSLGAKIHTSCKILKFCWHFRGTKAHMGKMFGIWYFFYLKRQGYVEKDHIIFIHKSYNDRFDNWHMLHTYICLLLLVYAWFWTCISLHLCSFFPYDLLKFSGCYLSTSEWVTVLNLLLYICFLIYSFNLVRDELFTVYVCLKKP